MNRMMQFILPAVLAAILLVSNIPAADENDQPEILQDVGLDQKLNSQIPLDLRFTDADGNPVVLSQYFGKKPVLLTLVYYECPMLCTLVLNGTLRALRALEFSAGNEFEILTISIDPEETPELAARKRESYLKNYGREGADQGWHFLVGSEDQIRPLADAVGFRYTYDPESGEYAHASGIMILTPEGKVARYFYGVEYSPRDMKLGFIEAAENKIGSPVDQILLFCYHYDPLTGNYSFAIMTFLRTAGALTVLGIVFLLVFLLRREKTQAVSTA